jgi:hypothetical protein
MVEPTKAAKAIVERAGLDFAQALAIELADLVKTT